MNLGKSSVKIFISKASAAGANFLGVIIFTRLLGGSLVGSFFLFEALLGLLSIPANFGLRDGVEKRVSEGVNEGSYVAAAALVKIVPVTLISLVVVLLSGWINAYIGTDLALFLVGLLFVREYALLSVSVLRGELRVGETAILKIVQQASWLGIGTLLILLDFGVTSLVFGLLAGYSLMLLWGWWKISTELARPAVSHFRSLFDYSKFSFVSSVGGYFYNWMDIVIIGLFLSQAHVTAYEIAWRVTMIVMLFSRSLATTIFPQVSRWDAVEARERIESIIPTVLLYSLLFVIPAFFGALVLSNEILEIIFGIDIAWAWLVLVILMGEKILQAIHVVIGRSLQALDRPDLAAVATLATIVVNLVLNVVLVWQFGLVGAAVATTVSFLVNTGLHWHYLRQFVTIDVPVSRLGWVVASAAGMWVMLELLGRVVPVTSLVVLVATIGAGSVIYGILLVSSRSIRSELLQRARSVV